MPNPVRAADSSPVPPSMLRAARSLSPEDTAVLEELKARMITVMGKSKVAEETMKDLRENARKQGQVLHPNIESQYSSMKLALDAAQKALDEGDIDGAKDSLGIASARADRVLKEGGR